MASSQKGKTDLAMSRARRVDKMNRSLSFERFLHLVVALLIIGLLGIAGVPATLTIPASLVFLIIRVLEHPHLLPFGAATFLSESRSRGRQVAVLLSIGGVISGGFIGYLLRPSVPLIGQLSFEHVITRGSTLRGIDAVLLATAEASFNYLIVGAIIGGGVGAGLAFVLSRRKAQLDTEPSSVQTMPQGDIAESIRNLADLKDKGILTEEEFQRKKTELLNRI